MRKKKTIFERLFRVERFYTRRRLERRFSFLLEKIGRFGKKEKRSVLLHRQEYWT